ncbi:hypothetical protein DPMN_087238 [Dreissena polymorpha]|uniref:Uncharacterized protein n=1 Tax=Dreissena polymorpha TaxID=45954 RepID=A0A9D4KSB7_DREPO|nr:hypothetical protein DPMN_087238 [Dreissena polymorpha]
MPSVRKKALANSVDPDETPHDAARYRYGSIALPELSSDRFTSPAEVTGHKKLHSMTDSETALNIRPFVSKGSVPLQHPGQTDTFRSLSEKNSSRGIKIPGVTEDLKLTSDDEFFSQEVKFVVFHANNPFC